MYAMRRAFFRIMPAVAGLALFTTGLVVLGCGGAGAGGNLSKVALGQALFSTNLSNPDGQSCASCHQPGHLFVDPRQDSPTSAGAVPGVFGNRQTPTIMYSFFAPSFFFDEEAGDYLGGQFWDGRASDLKDQVHFPLLNPFEMNNASVEEIVGKVQASPLAAAMKNLYGPNIFDDPNAALAAIADALVAFETSPQMSPFSSKYDAYMAGNATLTPSEERGLTLFNGKAHCANCHPSAGTHALFTDFSYDNIGLPKNPNNRFYNNPPQYNPDGDAFIDHGLFNTTHRPDDDGGFKVPTLRNIELTGPYFHNGVIDNLTDVVQFYNRRDLGDFGDPEVPFFMNTTELGNLSLTDDEVADIVAFMKTLTDGYRG